ncbi:MAG: response regulator [Elusimicrobia bacterium]|nr:response regulator [Elusimicrobiota bacterium]
MSKILLVDDKEENIYLLEQLLKSENHETISAKHGAEALTKARMYKPDLIISDLLMPVMDGYMLLSRWKADDKLKEIPFVVYTATYTDPKDEILAKDLGADEFLIKPMEPEIFVLKIKEIIEKYKNQKTLPAKAFLGMNEEKFKAYNETLIRKLEEKAAQLELANRTLEKEMLEREKNYIEKEKLKEQLNQSQKMEFIGRLAGGIAHDFNNLLTAIICSAETLKENSANNKESLELASDILEASERAASLTKQLLAFARKQILNPKQEDLKEITDSMVKMMKRIVGENIKIKTDMPDYPCFIYADRNQIEQVILNLTLNAKDAYEEKGVIEISLRAEEPKKDFFSRHKDFARGKAVILKISDKGKGMSEDVKKHIFEPFFTTKEQGKGTGLGLSTVYGIVKQSGGAIEVESRQGEGTSFFVYLPFYDPSCNYSQETEKKENDKTEIQKEKCGKTILFAEDEEIVRKTWEKVLKENGYEVISASDPYEALIKAEKYSKKIDLLITDMIMPGMSGKDLSDEFKKRNICFDTLYISGYTENFFMRIAEAKKETNYLEKPFTREKLLKKIKDILKNKNQGSEK